MLAGLLPRPAQSLTGSYLASTDEPQLTWGFIRGFRWEEPHGFRSIAEALYLHDHIITQLELAAVAADPEERRARCTFVVVGAGYTGTEVTAQGQLLTTRLARTMPGLAGPADPVDAARYRAAPAARA